LSNFFIEFLLNQKFLKDIQIAFSERFRTARNVLSAVMSKRKNISSVSSICILIVGWFQINLNQLTLNKLLQMNYKLHQACNLLIYQPTDLWDIFEAISKTTGNC
jgi:hypothetical protein